MNQTYVTGFPRIGENRELKFALEAFWTHKLPFSEVQNIAKTLREKNWLEQKKHRVDFISCNDFSYYDAMLDTSVMLGAIPKRFLDIEDSIQRYFAMARGDKTHQAMEMTKWFNTNYHYIVPELSTETVFQPDVSKIKSEYLEAKKLGITPKINLIGPLTYVYLSRLIDGNDRFTLFDALLEAYVRIFDELKTLDATVTIQCDEPVFVKTLEPKYLSLLKRAYERLSCVSSSIKIAVVTYFDHAKEAIEVLGQIPVWAIGLDFVYGKENLEALLHLKDKTLIAGIIDGRNVWRNDLVHSMDVLSQICDVLPKERIILATSCSLLHVPYSLRNETFLDKKIQNKLAFAVEKLNELDTLRLHFFNQHDFIGAKPTPHTHPLPSKTLVYARSPYATRRDLQQRYLHLPVLPTTTIGSFPQTKEIRAARAAFKKGEMDEQAYDDLIKESIAHCIEFQESIGLDVLVHGEFERNDMVEYFGEHLEGFAFSANGWVQSYGSRCVKPPLLYGDVSRKAPMTVQWSVYAQSLTDKPLKGMLTGPVTILNWSFVRNDIPKREVAYAVARAISEEVDELQRNDIHIIQVDEAAFKEGYPLRAEKVKDYENWAIESFKASVSSAWDQTQIHTHMCYSDFNDIIDTIERMDADVITIETARSGNKLLQVFQRVGYKAMIGPGVYDIHSPRVPSVEEMREQIEAFLRVLPKEQLWINPDCGLKTRGWEETKTALTHMVEAVKLSR